MLTIILILLLLWAVSKWIIYRLSFMAILLYYAECGLELPDHDKIQEYRLKVVNKSFGR